MLILKIKALLADEKQISIRELDNILKQVQTEKEFDEAIKPFIKSSDEAFKKKWADYGVAETFTSLWDYLVNTHYRTVVENAIQNRSKTKISSLRNNVTAVAKVARDVVNDLVNLNLGFGEGRIVSIEKAINDCVHRAFQNNKAKYIKELTVNDLEESVNHSLVAPLEEDEESLEDRLERLASVPKAEVRAILYDIYECRAIYKFNNSPKGKEDYSIYESFLRIHFKMQLGTFNEKYKGHFMLDVETKNDVKYKKYDDIMENLYNDFIIPGVSKENISELQHTVFLIQKKLEANNANPIFGQKSSEYNPVMGGNFNTGYVFASEDTALPRFDQFIRGLIAISKLYKYLSEAGFTPYVINPAIFQFNYEDPSEKFNSLKDLVLYSDTYVEARKKWNLNCRRPEFKALEGSNAGGFVLNLDTDSTIISNRNKIQLDSLASSILNLINNETSYVTMVLSSNVVGSDSISYFDARNNINLFSLVDSIEKEKNPLYEVYQDSAPLWEELGSDPDEIFDTVVIQDFFSSVLNMDSQNYSEPEMTKEYLTKMIEESDSPFSVLVNDILKGDYESKSKIILAIQDFALDFSDMLKSFRAKYEGIKLISEMEYSTFLYKSDLLKPLHGIVNAQETAKTDVGLSIKAMEVLLKKYYPEITVDKLNAFFDEQVSNTSYSNFLNWVKVRSFTSLLSCFHCAKANLFNLSDYGTPIMLSEADLMVAHQNARPVLNKDEFDIRFGHVDRMRSGYLCNKTGELYHIINHKNRIGALHTNGYYVFTDGRTLPWSGDL